MNKLTESQVLKKVLIKLKALTELTGDVLWHSRLQAGKINLGRNWIQLSDPGTPDVIAIIRCMDNRLAILFIECKRTGVTRLRYEQQQFFNSMETKPMVACVIINDPAQLNSAIKKAREL